MPRQNTFGTGRSRRVTSARQVWRILTATVFVFVADRSLADDYNYDFVKYPVKAVNDRGFAILNCDCSAGGSGRASIYRANTYTDLTPPRMGSASDVVAVAINNQNQVLLYNHNTATARVDFFLYDIDHDSYRLIGTRARLVSSPNVQDMRIGPLIALNDDGEVLAAYGGWVHSADPSGVAQVGGVAYGKPALGEPGSLNPPSDLAEFTRIPPTACITSPKISAFNTHHQFTGTCVLKAGQPAVVSSFIRSENTFVEVAVPDAPWTEITAINNAGVVVGFYQPARGADQRAFVFDGKAYTTLMRRGAQPPSNAASAHGLNDRGQVAGLVFNEGDHGFIATPSAGNPASFPESPNRTHANAPTPERAAAPRSLPPATRVAPGFATHSYVGLNATVSGGVLSFVDAAANGRTITFSGALPVRAADGSASPKIWIAKDADGYVMLTMLPSGMVSGTGLPQKIGEETYEKARRAQVAP